MDIKIFNSICTYIDMYRYLSDSKKSKSELYKFLVNQCSKSDSTARSQIKKAEGGDMPFIKVDAQGYFLDKSELGAALIVFGEDLGIKSKDAVVKKKTKPEDEIPSVLSGHSPMFKQMQESVNDMDAMEKRYKAMLSEKDKEILRLSGLVEAKLDDLVAAYAVQRILILDTLKTKPEEHFKKDFFKVKSDNGLPIEELVRSIGRTTVTPLNPEFKAEQNLTLDNYFRRITKLIFENRLFRKRWDKPADLNETVVPMKPDASKEERKRLESINEILAMCDIPNQVKLSLYATWFTEEDPEMVELLAFAGKYDINADYVIRILEKPREFRNYRTMRGMLQQAREASEAHIKREAAMELIRGDWYVEADYMGKPCKFAMMPIDELQEFLELLKNHESKKAVGLLEKLLTEERTVSEDGNTARLKVNAKRVKGKMSKNDESRKNAKIETPDFLHAQDEGIDMYPQIDEDSAFDGFKEAEVQDEE